MQALYLEFNICVTYLFTKYITKLKQFTGTKTNFEINNLVINYKKIQLIV